MRTKKQRNFAMDRKALSCFACMIPSSEKINAERLSLFAFSELLIGRARALLARGRGSLTSGPAEKSWRLPMHFFGFLHHRYRGGTTLSERRYETAHI
jgi:hypothetical protein